MKAEFETIYKNGAWGGGSGQGSDPAYCQNYITYVQSRINFLAPGSVILDLGCGDWRVGSCFNYSGVQYIGVDVVESVIQHNISAHGTENIIFQMKDFSDPEVLYFMLELHKPAMILCKDVLQHWPDLDVKLFLHTLDEVAPDAIVIITNDWRYVRSKHKNEEVRLSGRDVNNRYRWAPIDLTQSPWDRFGYKAEFYYPRNRRKMVCTRQR